MGTQKQHPPFCKRQQGPMFHPQNPSDPISTAAGPAAPPSPIPHFKTPDLHLPVNLPQLPGNLPQFPGNLPHLPSPHLPGSPFPGLAPPVSPLPAVPDKKKGLRSRLKLPKRPKTPKVKAPLVGNPLKLGKTARVKLVVTKIKARLGMGVKVPSTKVVTSAVPVEVPVTVPAAVPVSTGL